jgi:hypothetical protein
LSFNSPNAITMPVQAAAPVSIRLRERRGQSGPVNKLCITAGTLVCGYGVGYLFSGFGIMTEVLMSGLGSIIGVYLGWKVAQHIER